MKSRVPALAAVVLVLALAAAGCGGSGSSSTSTSSAGATSAGKSLTTVSMVQDWPFAWAPWIPWIVADQRGYFQKQGIKLKVVIPGNVSDPAKIISTHRADVAFTTILDVILSKAQGANLTATGALTQQNNWGIIFRQGDKPNICGLKGKRVGIYEDAWTKAQLKLMLASCGLSENDVTQVPAPSDTAVLLLAKKVDATTGVTNGEQAEIDTRGKEHSTMVLGKDHGVPNSYVDVLAMNGDFLSKHPTTAKGFMTAYRQGLQWAIAHPTPAVNIFLKRYPGAASRAQAMDAWKATVVSVQSPDTKAHGLLWSNGAVWSTVASTLHKEGLTTKTVDPKTLYTNTLLGQ
jgi:putative hydroxymethylpyrimidine transport system substrate-binding protein